MDWSTSWYVEVDESGAFTTLITTPSMEDQLPSDTRIHLSPHVERRGPIDDQSPSSYDKTPSSTHIPFLFDRVRPTTIALLALDSGGYAPADNHLWVKGQDVALRVSLEDQEGLANSLELHTWLESKDDANLDGIMDAVEYTIQTVSFNSGLTEAIVDLPLLPWVCLLYTSPSPRDATLSRMPSSA